MFTKYSNESAPVSLQSNAFTSKDPVDLVSEEFKPMFTLFKQLNKIVFTLFCPAYLHGEVDEKYGNLNVLIKLSDLTEMFTKIGADITPLLTQQKNLGFKNPFGDVLTESDGRQFATLRLKISNEVVHEFRSLLVGREAWSGASVLLELLSNTYAPFGEIKEPGLSFKAIHLHKKPE